MTRGPELLIYLLAFCAAFLAFQVFIGAGRQAAVKVRMVNERLRRMQSDSPQTQIITKIRKSRGLTAEGHIRQGLDWLNTMVLHSGLKLGAYGIYAVIIGFALCLGVTLFLLKHHIIWLGIGGIIGALSPIALLVFLTNRRRDKAVRQLPEALDVIIRSLSAGHPVPVAMNLVAREMPDPIGSEFGIASDEVSFGANMSEAIQRLSDRVGHDDFELFSAMIRLQERTGGNLAELLKSNAKTIRDRQRMRLKIKAASAEGRMSALILNAAPIGLYLILNKMAPQFYGDVSDNPIVGYALWGVVIWMFIGNLVMRRMINFKI